MTRPRWEGAHAGARHALPCALLACVLLGCGDSDGDGSTEPDAGGAAGRDAAPAAGSPADSGGAGAPVTGSAGSAADAAVADAAVDAALGDAATAPGTPQPVSYGQDVQPIFDAKCVDCHHPGSATKLDLTDVFDPVVGLVNRMNTWLDSPQPLLVEPGHPERSFLVRKIVGADLDHEGSPMPWMQPRLTEAQIATLTTWITDGALDDDRYRDEVVLIFGDGVT